MHIGLAIILLAKPFFIPRPSTPYRTGLEGNSIGSGRLAGIAAGTIFPAQTFLRKIALLRLVTPLGPLHNSQPILIEREQEEMSMRRIRLVLALVAVLAAMIAMAEPAWAHWVYGWCWDDSSGWYECWIWH
jgi:hypothetical protein